MGKINLVVEPGKQEFSYTRVFDAPPALVFKAYTDPDLLRRWLGPRRLKVTAIEMDVRPGGSWHFVHTDEQGNDYGFHGVFHTVEAPARLIRTFEYEGVPGHVSLETAIFEDLGGKTRVTEHSVFQSIEDRDGMVNSGMEEGMADSEERLDELLKAVQAGRAPVR